MNVVSPGLLALEDSPGFQSITLAVFPTVFPLSHRSPGISATEPILRGSFQNTVAFLKVYLLQVIQF